MRDVLLEEKLTDDKCARERVAKRRRARRLLLHARAIYLVYGSIVLYEGDTVTRVSRVGARREETQRREETRRKFVTRVLHRLDGRYFFQSRDGPSLGAISRRARWVRRAMFKAIRDTFSAFRRQGQVRDWRNGRAGAPSTRTSTSRPA